MGRLARTLAALLSAILTLLVVIIGLLLYLDVDAFRGPMERRLSVALAREVQLGGPISLELSPTPRLVVEGVRVRNPDWASRKDLAIIDRLKVKANLWPLLDGELEILAMEFHGVDLLLEDGPGDLNNYTFGDPGEPALLPVVERLFLYDARIGWLPHDGALKQQHLDRFTAIKIPGQPIVAELSTRLDSLPLSVSLQATPVEEHWSVGPWDTRVTSRIGGLELVVHGRVPEPTRWYRGTYGFDLEGQPSAELLELVAIAWPRWGNLQASGELQFNVGEYLSINRLLASAGDKHLQGWLRWPIEEAKRAGFGLREVLEYAELELQASSESGLWRWQLPENKFARELVLGELMLARDQGEALLGTARGSLGQQLSVSASASLNAPLPLTAEGGISLPDLAAALELDIRIKTLSGMIGGTLQVAGRPLEVESSQVHIAANPGGPLQLKGSARLGAEQIELLLRGPNLNQLLEAPRGPWNELRLEGEGEAMDFEVSGSVEHPMEGRGVRAQFSLQGADLDRLLPLLDLVLPLQGAYSLSGRFRDTGAASLFDELSLRFGRSDISGQLSVAPGKERPRVEADLKSDAFYLMEFSAAAGAGEAGTDEETARVIPDFLLPLDSMGYFDGQLRFRVGRLLTSAAELGEADLTMSLDDGRLSLEEFRITGLGGAVLQAHGSIDASQEPPPIDLRMSARGLNYGELLQQAGLAERVEGTLDLTLALSGAGRSRHEFLGNAYGEFILVGEAGVFGSRRLDLWGSDLVTTMLSPRWRRDDVTELNCLVAKVNIEDGVARSDQVLVDTRRITIGATGTLDLASEELNLVFAPRPKRTSLVSLTNPARVTGTLSTPEVSATVLPRRRLAAAGGGVLAGLLNPAYLVFTFSQMGSRNGNPCEATIAAAEAAKMEHFGTTAPVD